MTATRPAPPQVLVVDDEALLRMDAVDILERSGFTAIEAKNAADALTVLAENSEVRVVFTDVNMPPGPDGFDLAREVHRRWPNILLIITSGDRANAERDMPDHGQFIAKPYAPSALTDALDGMMKKPNE